MTFCICKQILSGMVYLSDPKFVTVNPRKSCIRPAPAGEILYLEKKSFLKENLFSAEWYC